MVLGVGLSWPNPMTAVVQATFEVTLGANTALGQADMALEVYAPAVPTVNFAFGLQRGNTPFSKRNASTPKACTSQP